MQDFILQNICYTAAWVSKTAVIPRSSSLVSTLQADWERRASLCSRELSARACSPSHFSYSCGDSTYKVKAYCLLYIELFLYIQTFCYTCQWGACILIGASANCVCVLVCARARACLFQTFLGLTDIHSDFSFFFKFQYLIIKTYF